MRPIPEANILALTSELFSKTNIIKLPFGTTYSFQDTLNVIIHAATSTSNSIESASDDLKRKNPDMKILSADSIHDYINSNSIDYIMSSFRHINTEILDVIDIGGLTKNYAILVESLLQRISSMGVFVKTLFMDAEFFNFSAISTLHRLNIQYVIAAASNKKINRMLNEHKKKFGSASTILDYQFEKGGPIFNIVAILNPKYDPKAKKEKGNNEYFLFPQTNRHRNCFHNRPQLEWKTVS